MTTHPVANLVQRLWASAILNGLLAVILGVVILLWPGPSILVAAVVFGVYLLVSGIAQVVSAFSLPASAGGRILLFISGAASVILAVLAFRHFGEGYAILLLAIWIAVGFIFRGVAATATAISDPAFPGRGWAIFFGIISILAGIVVLAWPFDSIVTLALVAGIWLIILGVMEIAAGFGMRSDAKKVEKKITAPRPDSTAASNRPFPRPESRRICGSEERAYRSATSADPGGWPRRPHLRAL